MDIREALDKIRPHLQADGGDVSFVSYVDGILTVKLHGTCQGCPYAEMTLKNGIKRSLQEKFPDLIDVINAEESKTL